MSERPTDEELERWTDLCSHRTGRSNITLFEDEVLRLIAEVRRLREENADLERRLGAVKKEREQLREELMLLRGMRADTERRLGEAERDAERWRWLQQNSIWCDASARPVLASVSKRLWYHATYDTHSETLDELADAALARHQEKEGAK